MTILYNLLVSKCKESSNNNLQAWRIDLTENITEEEWTQACSLVQTQSVNTHSKLLQYKWLSRQYITPARLHHFNPSIPDSCIKCNHQKGSLIHCMWECPQIIVFWGKVLDLISHIIGKEVPCSPKICILNIYPDDFVISNNVRSLLNICLLEAKRCIARSWKNQSIGGISQWLKGMSLNVALEKISYFAKNKLDKFWEIWHIFYNYLEQNEIQIDAWTNKLN